MSKKRLLTGDTPTGKLHLGHWVGSLENRVKLQDEYDCYLLVANTHAFTTRVDDPKGIQESTLSIVLDYLSAGIDPAKVTIFAESDVPAIFELASFFSMLLPFPRVMRNPTIKDEIRTKGLGENYSFGFLLYPVLQVADILAVQGEVVPVGEDQVPHIEMTREVARRFNQLYCGVNSHAEDKDHLKLGGIFPIPEVLIGRGKRLVGIGAPGADGQLLKMGKSLNNAIYLSDSADEIKKKVMSMYTDPKRLKPTDPGTIENNPLWIFHETFNEDKNWVAGAQQRYREGKIGDVECKKKLIEVLVALLRPMQERRKIYENDLAQVKKVLQDGAEKVNAIADQVLNEVRKATKQVF